MQWMQPSNDRYAAHLIRFKAWVLSRRRAFAGDDQEDIEHDLWLDLLERLPKYAPEKATLNTFIALVVERRVATLIRDRSTEKRSTDREECSLDEPVLDADGRVVPPARNDARGGQRPGPSPRSRARHGSCHGPPSRRLAGDRLGARVRHAELRGPGTRLLAARDGQGRRAVAGDLP